MSQQPMNPQDAKRRKLVWESLLGFVGFFTVLALIQAVWNMFRDEPAMLPSIVLLVLVILMWLIWQRYRKYAAVAED